MDILSPKISSQETFPTSISPAAIASAVDMNLISLQGFFKVQNPNTHEQKELSEVYKFFDKQGYESMTQVMMELSRIRNQIGMPPFGMSFLQHVHNYIRILSQINELEGIKNGFTTK